MEAVAVLLADVVIETRKTPLTDEEIDAMLSDDSKIKLAAALLVHDKVNEFGPMHIVVADGNMDDDHLDFVEVEMKKFGATPEEWELLTLLRNMSVDERDVAWEST